MRSKDGLKVTDQERLYAFAAGDPKAEIFDFPIAEMLK